MTISIEVEAFAGTHISAVADEMVRLADLLSITVMGKFNGVRMMACPGDDSKSLADQTIALMDSDKPEWMILARGRMASPDPSDRSIGHTVAAVEGR